MMTPAAILTRIGGVDLDELTPSFFRFGTQLGEKGRPCHITDTLGQTMVVDHAVDRQIFHGNDPVSVNDLSGLLMGEILSLERDTFMDSRHHLAMLATLRRACGKFRVLALHFGKGLLFLAKKARVRNLFPTREGGKGLETDVNADLLLTVWQTFWFTFTRKGHTPLASRGTMNGRGLDGATHRPHIPRSEGRGGLAS